MILAVSGPTGSGKTSLAHHLAVYTAGALVAEPLPHALLVRLSRDARSNCFDLQRHILLGRAENAQRCRSQRPMIIDRTVREDVEVFVTMHHRDGRLTDHQVAELEALAQSIEAEIGCPDAIVVVSARRDVLLARMRRGGAPAPLIKSLDLQLELYDTWMSRVDVPHVRVDTTDRHVEDLPMLAAWIQDTAVRAIRGETPLNLDLDLCWKGRAS